MQKSEVQKDLWGLKSLLGMGTPPDACEVGHLGEEGPAQQLWQLSWLPEIMKAFL